MNCPKCGNFLPQGAPFCPLCNEPISPAVYNGYAQPPQGYAQQPYDPSQAGYADFQQGYQQYPPQPNYPQGFQPIYGGYSTPKDSASSLFLASVLRLPGMFADAFRNPGAVLQGIMERRDFFTAPVIAGLALLLSFLCGILATPRMISVLLNFLGLFFGQGLASPDGINRLAGSIGVSIGGMAVLCQLLAILLPLAVMLVYLCAVCKIRFSPELACGLITLLTMPTIPASLLLMLTSLFSSFLPFLFIVAGMTISYIFMGNLVSFITGKPESELTLVKIIMILLSMALTFAAIALVTSLLSDAIFASILTRLGIL